MRLFSIVLALLFVVSCKGGADSIAKEETQGGMGVEQGENLYKVTATPESVPAGKETTVIFTIEPTDGYKWNDEYPASFKVTVPEGVKAGKTEFSSKKGEVTKSERNGTFAIPLTLEAAGAQKLS